MGIAFPSPRRGAYKYCGGVVHTQMWLLKLDHFPSSSNCTTIVQQNYKILRYGGEGVGRGVITGTNEFRKWVEIACSCRDLAVYSTWDQGCGSAFIFCWSGSSCFFNAESDRQHWYFCVACTEPYLTFFWHFFAFSKYGSSVANPHHGIPDPILNVIEKWVPDSGIQMKMDPQHSFLI